jgi:hypothetical protein
MRTRHTLMRVSRLAYLDGLNPYSPHIGRYFAAASKWEDFALQLGMAMDAFKWINGGSGAFSKNDSSKEYRLYTIANQIKHTRGAVESQQCTPMDVIPLWMTPSGLSSFSGVEVTYVEAAEVLLDVAVLADKIQNPGSFVGAAAEAT